MKWSGSFGRWEFETAGNTGYAFWNCFGLSHNTSISYSEFKSFISLSQIKTPERSMKKWGNEKDILLDWLNQFHKLCGVVQLFLLWLFGNSKIIMNFLPRLHYGVKKWWVSGQEYSHLNIKLWGTLPAFSSLSYPFNVFIGINKNTCIFFAGHSVCAVFYVTPNFESPKPYKADDSWLTGYVLLLGNSFICGTKLQRSIWGEISMSSHQVIQSGQRFNQK